MPKTRARFNSVSADKILMAAFVGVEAA